MPTSTRAHQVDSVWVRCGADMPDVVQEYADTAALGNGLVNLGNTCYMNSTLQCAPAPRLSRPIRGQGLGVGVAKGPGDARQVIVNEPSAKPHPDGLQVPAQQLRAQPTAHGVQRPCHACQLARRAGGQQVRLSPSPWVDVRQPREDTDGARRDGT